MKKSTKIIICVIAILVIIGVVAIGLMLTSDLGQEGKLREEVDSVYALLNNYPLDYDALDEKLATTVTTDDYAKVEKAVKEYSGDFVEYMKQFDTLINDGTLAKAITVENIEADGPDFINTKQKLSEDKTSLETILTNFSNYLTEEVALSYIKDVEMDEYYTDLYKQYVIGNSVSEMESAKDEILNSLNSVKSLIETEEETIDFLVQNKGNWEIENDQLVFDSETLSNQYNEIIAKMNELA